MRSHVQQARFCVMTAFHLREIQAELASARASRDVAPSPDLEQPEASQPATHPAATRPEPPGRRSVPPLLDALTAELLDSGSLMFAAECCAGWSMSPAWHVFGGRPAETGDDVVLFEQAGVIGGELGDDDFVELAYRTILQRQPDPGGRRAYTETLQSGHQTRHGVLRDLANSSEAAATGQTLVILPGNWLSAGSDAGEALPQAVRIDRRRLPAAAASGTPFSEARGAPIGPAMTRVAAVA